MDPLLAQRIRPPWIELWRLTTLTERNACAHRWFGEDENGKPFTAAQFKKRLGINLGQCSAFYGEVCSAVAPEGPVVPATERLPVQPILAIRMSRSGNYYATGLSLAAGVFNKDKSKAWVPVDDYEALIGDTQWQKIQDEAAKMEDRNADLRLDPRKIQVVDGATLSPQEREIFKRALSGPAALPDSEQKIVDQILKRNRGG